MTLEQLAKQGRRTASMTTAATISSKMNQIRKENIKQAFSDFDNVKHRYEYVNTIDGVTYYDDSGACSNEASWFTFDNLHMPVIWITYADNIDCDELLDQAKKYVKAIICIGEKTERFHRIFDNILKNNIFDAKSIDEAVKMSGKLAEMGDNVVFSPAVPAQAPFDSFAERGDYYQKCVFSLA